MTTDEITLLRAPSCAPVFLWLPSYSYETKSYPGRELALDWDDVMSLGARGWERLWRIENRRGVAWCRT